MRKSSLQNALSPKTISLCTTYTVQILKKLKISSCLLDEEEAKHLSNSRKNL